MTVLLDAQDLGAIRDLAASMRRNVEKGRHPTDGKPVTLLGATVHPTSGPPGASVEIEKIRACFTPGDPPSVSLKPLPLFVEPYAAIIPRAAMFERSLVHALAHEICHLRQWQGDRTLFEHGGEGLRAAGLGRRAEASRLYSDNMDYVEHPLEAAAHATQLAAEVIARDGLGLDPDGFEAFARNAWVYAHVSDHPDCDRRGADEDRLRRLLKSLVDDAWTAYQAMS